MALINPAILMDPPCEPGCPRKRRRLDNLTPEERALRRLVSQSTINAFLLSISSRSNRTLEFSNTARDNYTMYQFPFTNVES